MATEKRAAISKGTHALITVSGTEFVSGTQYTACLYYSAKDAEHRANVNATAATVPDGTGGTKVQCVFDFTPTQTEALKTGDVILEVYDTVNKTKMAYWEPFTQVRASSLKE